jgi:repressor LexA
MIELTDRERETLGFIESYFLHHGYAPRLNEIADHLGIRSRGVVHRYLKSLEQAGHLQIIPNRARGIRLAQPPRSQEIPAGQLPLLGRIAAGLPIEAIPDQNTINLADFFVAPGRFVLRVQGDSMIEAGILDGDMVVVQSGETATDGEIVVALIDQEEATLKRIFQHTDGSITLKPENREMAPMRYPAARITLQGRVVGQFRAY